MTDKLRSIIQELAKEPFKKSFTVISFDSLTPDQLLQVNWWHFTQQTWQMLYNNLSVLYILMCYQVLNDVLAEVDPANKLDIREEDPEQTVVRMLNMLRVLKYRPPDDDP